MQKINSLIKIYHTKYQEALMQKVKLLDKINNYEKNIIELDLFGKSKNNEFTKNIYTLKLLMSQMQYKLQQKNIIDNKIADLKKQILSLENIAKKNYQQKLAFQKIQNKIYQQIQQKRQKIEIKSNESIVDLFLHTKQK